MEYCIELVIIEEEVLSTGTSNYEGRGSVYVEGLVVQPRSIHTGFLLRKIGSFITKPTKGSVCLESSWSAKSHHRYPRFSFVNQFY